MGGFGTPPQSLIGLGCAPPPTGRAAPDLVLTPSIQSPREPQARAVGADPVRHSAQTQLVSQRAAKSRNSLHLTQAALRRRLHIHCAHSGARGCNGPRTHAQSWLRQGRRLLGAGATGGRTVEADAAGRCRWLLRPTVAIWGRGQVLALTSQVRPRPAHDLCRDHQKVLLCADGTSDSGGGRGYPSGDMLPDAGDGCGSHKWPSGSARHPTTDAPGGLCVCAGGQEVGRVRGLLVR